MSSHQILAQCRPVTINFSTLGRFSFRLKLSKDSLHPQLPGAFVIDDYSESMESANEQVLDCLVMGSSPTPLLTLCMIPGDVCRYFVFDPLDPYTRVHLELFSRARAFPFIAWDSERAIPCAALAPMFEKGLERTRGREPASPSSWISQARTCAPALPGIYQSVLPSVACSNDHRVYIVVADQRLHDEFSDKWMFRSA